MVHQHELEDELTHSFEQRAPEVIGNEYMVMGTVDKKVWQKSLSNPSSISEILSHLADFKTVYKFTFEPAGWYPADDKRKR